MAKELRYGYALDLLSGDQTNVVCALRYYAAHARTLGLPTVADEALATLGRMRAAERYDLVELAPAPPPSVMEAV